MRVRAKQCGRVAGLYENDLDWRDAIGFRIKDRAIIIRDERLARLCYGSPQLIPPRGIKRTNLLTARHSSNLLDKQTIPPLSKQMMGWHDLGQHQQPLIDVWCDNIQSFVLRER